MMCDQSDFTWQNFLVVRKDGNSSATTSRTRRRRRRDDFWWSVCVVVRSRRGVDGRRAGLGEEERRGVGRLAWKKGKLLLWLPVSAGNGD